LNARIEELYPGFFDYKELFLEIRNYFSDNKKVLDVLNLIYQALGMENNVGIKANNLTMNQNNQSNISDNNVQFIQNNQSKINLFEGFITGNNEVNLINNDPTEKNMNNIENLNNLIYNTAPVSSNFDLFNVTTNLNLKNNVLNSNYLSDQNGNNYNQKPIKEANLFETISNGNNENKENLMNSKLTDSTKSNASKTFSFIKNKNETKNNFENNKIGNLINNCDPIQIQKPQVNNKLNPNDFSDLFSSLNLNNSNKNNNNLDVNVYTSIKKASNVKDNEKNLASLNLIDQTNSSEATQKKGFSFIKKNKHHFSENDCI